MKAAVDPCEANVTSSSRIVVTRPPMYGMNRPKKTMTARGAGQRHAQDDQEQALRDPVDRRDDGRPAQVAADPLEGDVSARGDLRRVARCWPTTAPRPTPCRRPS